MKAPRWNSYGFWLSIELVFLANSVFALNRNLRQEAFSLFGCALICELIGRNFQYSKMEIEESKKPLLEQERELALSFKFVGGVSLILLLLMAWTAAIGYKMLLLQGFYVLAPVSLYLIRRFRRLQHARRELRDQSTLRRHKLMGGA